MTRFIKLLFLICIVQKEVHAQWQLKDGVYTDTLALINEINADQLNEQNPEDNFSVSEEKMLDINIATVGQLMQIGLTKTQAESILDYRHKAGGFSDVHELQAVPYIDSKIIAALQRYILVRAKKRHWRDLPKQLIDGNMNITIRYDYYDNIQSSFNNESSQNSLLTKLLPVRMRLKISHQSSALAWGITGEKDAGESLLWNKTQRGLDNYLGYIRFSDKKLFRYIILGDYKVSIGQGLLISQSPFLGLASASLHGQVQREICMPNRGYDEVFFKRGLAVETRIGKMDLTLFLSIRRLDGTKQWDTILHQNVIRSINYSGLHRDSISFVRQKQIKEQCKGMRLAYNRSWGNIGWTALTYDYGYTKINNLKMYAYFDNHSRRPTASGLDYSVSLLGMHLFGETVIQQGGGWSMLHAVSMPVSSQITTGICYRRYGKDYDMPDAQVWGVSSESKNERGGLWHLRYQLGSNEELMILWDISRSDWLKYQTTSSVMTNQQILSLTKRWKKIHELKCVYKKEERHSFLSTSTKTIDLRYKGHYSEEMDVKWRYVKREVYSGKQFSSLDYFSLGADYTFSKIWKCRIQLFGLASGRGSGGVVDFEPDAGIGIWLSSRYGNISGGSIALNFKKKNFMTGIQYRREVEINGDERANTSAYSIIMTKNFN